MNGLMNSVSLRNQRAKKVAINGKFCLSFKPHLSSYNGQQSNSGWNFPGESLERRSEDTFSKKVRNSSREEPLRNLNREDEDTPYTYITSKKKMTFVTIKHS